MDFTPRMKEHQLVAEAAAAGSMVLLKNIKETLPLYPAGSEKLPVAVFGMGQLETVCCCGEFQTYAAVSLLDGLCASDAVVPDGLLIHKYRSHQLHNPGKEFPWRELSMEELAENNAAAIVVISRTEDAYDTILANEEKAMIEAVAAAFDRVVLVLNTPGYMEIAPVVDLCGAVVYMGIAGQQAGTALAQLLTGKALFRGKLNQSWPRRRADVALSNQSADIYCGYRYYDTFGTDLLYDFGYGLTYGAAELTAVSVAVDNENLIITAQVTNVGETWPVSQVVQVYVSRPEGELPHPKYVYQACGRTRVLDPGESQTIRIAFPISKLAAFSEDASGFLLQAGFYDIRVGFSARSTVIAGSLKVVRDAVVRPVLPMGMARTELRAAKTMPFSYPGEAEEQAMARSRAIRLSAWNIPKTALRKAKKPQLCRPGEEPVRLEDVKNGTATLQMLVAAMEDRDLRDLVLNFGFCPTAVAGALGASSDLREKYGIPPMTIAAGADGLLLTRDLKDEEDKVIGHQYCTAFPAASALGCCWDMELVAAVGAAVGKEMKEYGVDLWLAPGADVIRSPGQQHVSRCWSEDPVMAGRYTTTLAKAVGKYGAAVLRTVSMEHKTEATQRAFLDVYAAGFMLAAKEAKAVLLPAQWLNGEPSGEDTAQSRMLVEQWKFDGMFLADDERFVSEPDRVQLEQSALKILRFALTRI